MTLQAKCGSLFVLSAGESGWRKRVTAVASVTCNVARENLTLHCRGKHCQM